MPYTGDPAASDVDAVRFILSDTGATELLTDTEIEWLVSQKSNLYLAAAAGARILGSRTAGTADTKTVGPLSISRSNTSQRWFELAKQIESDAKAGLVGAALQPYSGGIDRDDKRTQETDTSWDKPYFRRSLMDRPDALDPYRLTSTSS